VTFKQTVKPPQGETEPEDSVPSPRVNEPIPQTRTATPIHTATIDRPIATTLTPRVQKIPTSKDNNPARIEMRDRIRKHLQAKTMARLTNAICTYVKPHKTPKEPNSYMTWKQTCT
jgi:hypothetical protein